MAPPRRPPIFDGTTIGLLVVSILAAAWLGWRDGIAAVQAVIGTESLVLLAIVPKILAGCLIGAFATLLLPRDKVAAWLGAESGFRGLLVATAAGAIVPGGPFTVFPIAAAFMGAGADIGAAIAFVTAWNVVGITRALVWELPFFGPEFVLWRSVPALALPLIAGFAARLVWRRLRKGRET